MNFLFGAGTSSGAIDTMSELYKNLKFSGEEKEEEKEFKSIVAKEGENLENILKVMYSARNYYNGIQEEDAKDEDIITSFKELYDRLITKVEKHIFDSINVDFSSYVNFIIRMLKLQFLRALTTAFIPHNPFHRRHHAKLFGCWSFLSFLC